MTIDELIARKRELGYSNEQIAELSGVPLGTVQKIFGKITKSPRRNTLVALEKVLKKPEITYYTTESGRTIVAEPAPKYWEEEIGPHTVEEYFALPDDCRAELIDGYFYELTTQSTAHQIIVTRLWAVFDSCIKEHQQECLALVAPFGVQLDKDEKTMVQPDVMIFCKMEELLNTHYYGAPDFVAEVLSPSTRSKDLLLKLRKYFEAGVREYWIIDPKYRSVIVYNLAEDLTAFEKYSFDDQIPLLISEGKCTVDFSEIHKEIERFLD